MAKSDEIIIRSSAAEYLTYVASVGDDEETFEVRYQDENIWLTPFTFSSVSQMNITNNLNVYAKWQYNTCMVNFYADNQKVGDTKQVQINTELTDIPLVPEKTGYGSNPAKFIYAAGKERNRSNCHDCVE